MDKLLEGIFDELNGIEFDCPNYWGNASYCDYNTLIEHYNAKECDGDPGFNTSKIEELKNRIVKMNKNNTYFLPNEDKIKLKEDWGEFNAKCLICQYLSNLDGYIWYNCTTLWWKQHWEVFTEYQESVTDETYHPYGFLLWVYCK